MQKRGNRSRFSRSKFSRSKRGIGTVLLLEAMQALSVMLVLTGSMSYVNGKLAKVGFAKTFYARDLSLSATALHAAPGNMFYMYDVKEADENASMYRFSFVSEGNIILVNATESPKQSLYWYFSDTSTEQIELNAANVLGVLRFAKEGNRIKIGTDVKANANRMTCPAVETNVGNWLARSVILDPAHGKPEEANKGDIALKIAENSGITSRIQNLKFTRREGVTGKFKTADERGNFIGKNAGADALIIGIGVGEIDDASQNYVKAYYNSESSEEIRKKSRKIGCMILNSIIEYSKMDNNGMINGLAVIPSNSDEIKKVLPIGKVGVMLELGNVEVPRSQNFLYERTAVAEAIYKGIEGYYTK